jgi:hypothetical protein
MKTSNTKHQQIYKEYLNTQKKQDDEDINVLGGEIWYN